MLAPAKDTPAPEAEEGDALGKKAQANEDAKGRAGGHRLGWPAAAGRDADPRREVMLDLSCLDWREAFRDSRSLVPTLQLPNPAAGDRAVAVFNRLRLADVPGTPTMGEAGGEWFRDIVRALFGALDPVTKARLIRELFLLVPKKNSKTTNGALLMLTALLLNERPRAPFLLTAPVQKTAEEAFSALAGAIALDPVLDRKLRAGPPENRSCTGRPARGWK